MITFRQLLSVRAAYQAGYALGLSGVDVEGRAYFDPSLQQTWAMGLADGQRERARTDSENKPCSTL